jgi:hypothetical protein
MCKNKKFNDQIVPCHGLVGDYVGKKEEVTGSKPICSLPCCILPYPTEKQILVYSLII